MKKAFNLVAPTHVPPLDTAFRPAVLANRAFNQAIQEAGGGTSLVIGLERGDGCISRFETQVFPEDHPQARDNLMYAERIFKFLLWQKGGWKAFIGGPAAIAEHLQKCYSPGGERAFDYHFMGEDVYEKEFTVLACDVSEVPAEREGRKSLGGYLNGCRIGFDLGASDRKVSAVINGETVFSEEVVWDPKVQADPNYHYTEIISSLAKAVNKMPRLDAIGGSAAGIYIDNKVRIASLFRGVPKERYAEVRNLFLRIAAEMQVPLEIANDGDVTALAGAMSLNDGGVLGIAMGSSEAGGYVDFQRNITGWLNELAFAPIDYNPWAPVDEWSGDRGVGAQYFSQECVFRLAPKVSIVIPDGYSKVDQLLFVQERLEAGDPGAIAIWETMGCYLGYALAHYADFYDLKHVLVLGRCTSGEGGRLIIEGARKVIDDEFLSLAEKINIQLPDEKSRRVGQAIAAASLPKLERS